MAIGNEKQKQNGMDELRHGGGMNLRDVELQKSLNTYQRTA